MERAADSGLQRAIAMGRGIEARLRGWPDEALTVALLGVAGALALVALLAPAWLKAVALAWALLP